MTDKIATNPTLKEGLRTISISASARSVLEKLPAPSVVSVMEDMVRLASEGNNNNNNNSGGGGSVPETRVSVSREELLQKLSTSLSDDQLQGILKQQGII